MGTRSAASQLPFGLDGRKVLIIVGCIVLLAWAVISSAQRGPLQEAATAPQGGDFSANNVSQQQTMQQRRQEQLPVARGEPELLPRARYTELVTAHTEQSKTTKAGMLPEWLWLGIDRAMLQGSRPPSRYALFPPAYRERFMVWLRAHLFGTGSGQLPTGQPIPYAGLCWPEFNVHYKFIFVRGVKTAGSSIEAGLLEPGRAAPPKCGDAELMLKPEARATPLQPLSAAHRAAVNGARCHFVQGRGCLFVAHQIEDAGGPQKLGYKSWEALWMDYTVFAPVRNPYDRAGSMYDYLPNPEKHKFRAVTFPVFAARPYAQGLESLLYSQQGKLDQPYQPLSNPVIHDFYHVEPQTKCMLTADGGHAVDLFLRTETMFDDMQAFLDIVNARRDSSLPEFENRLGWTRKGPSASSKGAPQADRHVEKYVQCGAQCLHDVQAYYKADFEQLKYPMLS